MKGKLSASPSLVPHSGAEMTNQQPDLVFHTSILWVYEAVFYIRLGLKSLTADDLKNRHLWKWTRQHLKPEGTLGLWENPTLEENNKQTWELQEELQMCTFFNLGLLQLMTHFISQWHAWQPAAVWVVGNQSELFQLRDGGDYTSPAVWGQTLRVKEPLQVAVSCRRRETNVRETSQHTPFCAG